MLFLDFAINTVLYLN